jgi:hypothetical protein
MWGGLSICGGLVIRRLNWGVPWWQSAHASNRRINNPPQVDNPMPLTLSRRVLFHSKKKEKAGQIKSNGLCF